MFVVVKHSVSYFESMHGTSSVDDVEICNTKEEAMKVAKQWSETSNDEHKNYSRIFEKDDLPKDVVKRLRDEGYKVVLDPFTLLTYSKGYTIYW